MVDLIIAPETHLSTDLLARIQNYASRARATSTVRSYRSALRAFVVWCKDHGVHEPFPAAPAAVAAYLADRAGTLKVATLERHLAALNEAHRSAGHEAPSSSREVSTVMKGIRRCHGTAGKGKAPLLVAHLREIAVALLDNTKGIRDRALLLLGFAGAFRRSELVGLDVGDLDFREEGLVVTLTRSKTDQEGQGRLIGIPYGSNPATCPVRSVQRWLDVAQVEDGPVLRAVNRHSNVAERRLSGRAVCTVVKQAVASIGLDPKGFGGHSLRAGLATEAARCGAGELSIMNQTGHRSLATLRGYVRHGTLFTNNAAAVVGL